MRARFRTLLAAARSRDESRKTTAAFAGILGAVEAREPHRIEHSARVGRLGADLARLAGLSDAEIERIRVGGILHDFGTVAIPDGILFKREPLTESEFAVMKSHPVIGFALLREVPALEPYLPFVLRHHERIDGSGYPDGLRGAEVTLPVQLVSIADAFDAMTSSRPYRQRPGRPLRDPGSWRRRPPGGGGIRLSCRFSWPRPRTGTSRGARTEARWAEAGRPSDRPGGGRFDIGTPLVGTLEG